MEDSKGRMRVVIRGKHYFLDHVSGLAQLGETDAPSIKSKEMRIRKSLKGKERLEIYIHEMQHAGQWDLDEEVVSQLAHDMANVLWKIGLRFSDE